MRFSPFNGRDVLLRVRVLIQGGLWKRRLFFVFKAGGETSGHANHAGIATTDGYDFDFLRRQGVKAIDDLVNQLVGEDEGRFQRHKRVFGFLKTVADFFFVGIFEAEFVGAEMGENFGGFKLPKLVELGFGLQGVSVNVVEIFEVGQELFGGRPFLLVHRHHPLGEKREQIMHDIRALRFGSKLLGHEGQHTVRFCIRHTALVKLLGFVNERSPLLFRRRELNATNGNLMEHVTVNIRNRETNLEVPVQER